jgi:ParB-like chromosome segregation protein Spo0J
MTKSELAELVEDIRTVGLLEPIITHNGEVLDGINRLKACELAGVEPTYREWDGEGGSPIAFVLSHNLQRRHLTASQRAAVAVESLPLFEAEAMERKRAGRRAEDLMANVPEGHLAPTSREQAAELVGASARYVQEAKAVKDADPDLFEQVKAGEVTLRTAGKKLGRVPGGKRGTTHKEHARKALKDVIDPLDKYLRNWDDDRLKGTTPAEARRMLAKVQRVNRTLHEVAIGLEKRTVVPRVLR